MKLLTQLSLLLLCAYLSQGLAGCDKDDNDDDNNNPKSGLVPKGPPPDWGPTMHDSMLVVIEKFQSFSPIPIESLTPQQARQQPTLTDAVLGVVRDYNLSIPAPTVDTMGRDIPVNGGSIHVRIYTPKNETGPFPGIVYYQGGGWVIGNLDVYDPSAKALAQKTNAVVVSVQYRKGPEFKFPTAHNDAFEAYRWVLENAASINIDAARIGVVGESAGGNLACNVSIMARDSGIALPKHQVLVYPVANNNLDAEAVLQYKDAKPLNRAMLQWFLLHYLNDISESNDPRIKLIGANLTGLPSTTIINAEIDPLRDDGKLLFNALQAAGVQVTRKLYDGVTHEFFGADIVLPEAQDAQAVAVAALKNAL